MPNSNDRFVALRELKHGDRTYQAGEEVPLDPNEYATSFLVDGGYLSRIPAAPQAPAEGGEDSEQGHTDGNADANGSEGGDSNDANGDDENDDENADPTVTAEGYAPGEHTVEEVVEYVEENPGELDAVTAAEEAGRGRKTLLAQLATMSESAGEADDDNDGE